MSGSALRVGVGIPTWNRPEGLRRALASVARQTRAPHFVVVVNDAGSDVQGIVDDFALRAPQGCSVRSIVHNVNRGNAAARNTIVQESPVDVIAFLDDDDELDREFMAHAERHFSARPSLAFGWPAHRIWVDDARAPRLISRSAWSGPVNPGPLGWLRERRTGASGLTFRRGVMQRVGGFDEELRAAVDTDWLVRAATEESMLLEGCWLDVHREPTHTGVSSSFAGRYRAYAGLLRKHASLFASDPAFHADLLARTARLALAADNVGDARRLLSESVRIQPTAQTAATLVGTYLPGASAAYRLIVKARSRLGA